MWYRAHLTFYTLNSCFNKYKPKKQAPIRLQILPFDFLDSWEVFGIACSLMGTMEALKGGFKLAEQQDFQNEFPFT